MSGAMIIVDPAAYHGVVRRVLQSPFRHDAKWGAVCASTWLTSFVLTGSLICFALALVGTGFIIDAARRAHAMDAYYDSTPHPNPIERESVR